ncbi:MAG TPA: flagellar filament capping protein FliD [Chitinispirillaceae bacterium]|nr:flagellar filament capping protein FliD [Chitinispirillaceae bacterium]
MGISINGPSGIDTQYIIDSLVELEKQKVTKVESQKKAYQVKIDAYSKFKSLLSDLRTKAKTLSTVSSFDLFAATSSNEKAVTIKGGTGSVDAQYDVRVFQLAANEKMISADGKITSQTDALSSMGIGVGDISIDGVSITVDSDDTIQDLRLKINNATDEKGNKIGASASVLKVSETDYRLVISSKDSGSTGIEYSDISGSTLQDLGIIMDAAGNKGNATQQLTSASDLKTEFETLAAGESITIDGFDHDGRAITGTIVKKSGETADDFLSEINKVYNGMVDASFDVDGNLMITDKVAGTSRLALNSINIGTSPHSLSVSVIGDEGAGVLSTGKDAYFSVEDVFMASDKNSASGFVTGATFELHGISAVDPVKVELTRDSDGIKKKFQELVDAYNAMLRFSKDSTKHANPDDENSSDGALAGDSTTSSIVTQVRSFFQQQFDSFGGTYTNFALIGLKTDTSNGEYTIDDEMFKKALGKGFDEVVRLFSTTGVSDNAGIIMGKNTKDTKSGIYTLEEVDSQHYRIQLQGSSDWITSDARIGEIISFSDGPAKGLSLTAPAGTLGTGSATFTFSKGLAQLIDENVNKLTNTTDGTVVTRQESWRRSIKYSDDRIDKLNERIEKYRLRLVKQFSDMEQAMSKMKTQGSSLSTSSFLYQ